MYNKENHSDLRSGVFKEIVSRVPPRLIRWGSLLFFLLILLVLLLMWLITYPDVITAKGYLTTPVSPQKLYAKTTSRIDTLLVKDNDSVERYQILAILENTAINDDVLVLKSVIDTLSMNQKNVFFPFEALPILFLGELDSFYADFETSYYQYIMNRDLEPYGYKLKAQQLSSVQLKNQLKNLVNQKTIHDKKLSFVKKDLDRHKALFKKGIISQQAYENKELDYYSELKNYENTNLMISSLRASLASAEGQHNNLEFLRQSKNSTLLKQVLQSYSRFKKSVKDWELKYVLKSRAVGKVSFLEQWDSNQTVTKGQLLFTVTSEAPEYYVARLQTPKHNSGKIKVGQRVNFSLNDYPEYDFGPLKGCVLNITGTSSLNGNYQVVVKIPRDLKTSFGKQIEFKQYMQGTADIVTEDLSLLERIFYQFRHLFHN
jgi:multidrug resistance efflux pump